MARDLVASGASVAAVQVARALGFRTDASPLRTRRARGAGGGRPVLRRVEGVQEHDYGASGAGAGAGARGEGEAPPSESLQERRRTQRVLHGHVHHVCTGTGFSGARDIATLDLDSSGRPVIAVQDRSQLRVLRVVDGGTEMLADFRAASGVGFKQQTDVAIDDQGRVHVAWWQSGGVPGTVCHAVSG